MVTEVLVGHAAKDGGGSNDSGQRGSAPGEEVPLTSYEP